MEPEASISGQSYTTLVTAIKQRIVSARISAARAVSRELIGLYWDIGQMIVEKQQESGWGKAAVETLSHDLQREFPAVTGFSPQNLWFMRQMYAEYCRGQE